MTDITAAPAPVQFSSTWMNFIGGFLAILVTLIVAAQTLIPYFMIVPESSAGIIGQQQTMFQTLFIMIVTFFFGGSVSSRLKDMAASKSADTAATQATTIAALTPTSTVNPVVATVATPTATMPLHAGQTATVQADAKPVPPAN